MTTSSAPSQGLADPRLRADLARTVGHRLDRADVEDIVQTVLAEALASGRIPEAPEDLRRFLFAIARHRVVDWYRRRAREAPSPEAETPVAPETTASNDLLRWALGGLPAAPGTTQTFQWMLREGDGETLAEISATEHVPAAAVRQRVSRLRRFFRARWAKEIAALALLAVVLVPLAWFVGRGDRAASVVPRPPPPPPSGDEITGPAPRPAAKPGQAAPSAAPPPEPRPAPSAKPHAAAPSVPFDRKAAAAALAAVDLRGCATPSTPSGKSQFRVVFAPDGTVSSAFVDSGPLRALPEASCVWDHLAGLHVPPFDGAPVMMARTFELPGPTTTLPRQDPWSESAPRSSGKAGALDGRDPWATPRSPASAADYM